MITSPSANRTDPKTIVLEALARLRAAFPIEARLLAARAPVRATYAQVLALWLRATSPQASMFDAKTLATLVSLDAVVPEAQGLGCYPFSSNDTGIRVTLPANTVHAMCAIDALAIARLVRARTHIDSACTVCDASIAFEVEENGGLDHDQAEMARVVWQQTGDAETSCSQGLCRHIRFLCRACPVPVCAEHFTLPQAAAIGHAFFRFQSALLAEHDGVAARP
jgi:hypothetical protein